ncbi:unnamed protein product [Anisakis simplex]|uniref:Tyrosine 3-monooxygenase (inferred by orthology to a C. elegans protein) n=1 Tax=Anisakis simplex TaxID=6269 RepID=A0A0M3J3V8_ANISI|nr:unnamed protein product [Anisakis simplex]
MLRPCSGLLSARDFLASLAFRVFQTTLYVRHTGSPHHSPEPDLIHEFIGHCPMFADPTLAQFSQEIGLLSLGATDEQIEHLATVWKTKTNCRRPMTGLRMRRRVLGDFQGIENRTRTFQVYWFIIEFGLCRQEGRYKAIGAGLLSSYGELMHACSDKPDHRPFDPETTALQKVEDADYQPLYFVADSIIDAMIKLRRYARSIKRPFSVVYDPITRSVEIIKEAQDLVTTIERFKADLSAVTDAIEAVSKDAHQHYRITNE